MVIEIVDLPSYMGIFQSYGKRFPGSFIDGLPIKKGDFSMANC